MNMGIMPTKIELTLEQSQQGVSNDVLCYGIVGAGCSQLLSDMKVFKGANPGCILVDFVRWHSPADWMEPPSDDESKEPVVSDSVSSRGHLSDSGVCLCPCGRLLVRNPHPELADSRVGYP
ncbi:Rab3 GTPase-activating protein catalytic subunit [Tanacetum coccineum]|uniref:Rab3 GTPase-activating protein catalytic subunit n=1 Tax=Tanacetum coccineum TaxID=301880 RepID=A0ABQ5FSF8_9ASTR